MSEREGTERRDPARARGRDHCGRTRIEHRVLMPVKDERDEVIGEAEAVVEVELVCRDERAFHSPCSKCPCPEFVEPSKPEVGGRRRRRD